MKNKLIFLLLFHSFTAYTQKNKLILHIGCGVSTNFFFNQDETGVLNYDFGRIKNLNITDLGILYGFTIFKKQNINLITGIDYIQTKYYQAIYTNKLKNIHNVIISNYDLTFNIFGISKQINFYNNKISLNFSLAWIERLFLNKTKSYNSNLTTSPSKGVKYKYNINTYNSKFYNNDKDINKKDLHFNFKYSAFLSFKLNDSFNLNVGVNYMRNYVFFYDFSYEILFYYNNSSTPNKTDTFNGYNKLKFGVKDNFLNFNIGLSFKF